MLKSRFLIIILMILGISVLLALGTWQMQRLKWKEELITLTHQRAAQKAMPLSELELNWKNNDDVDYIAASLSGKFIHEYESYYYNTWKGKVGWNVITPFQLDDNRVILVNRGFVPDQLRERSHRIDTENSQLMSLTGLARNPVLEKPNSFIPENDLKNRQFFWKSQTELISLIPTSNNYQFLPFLFDVDGNSSADNYPIGGTTRMEFPNNHLQYALTWYGLALALLGVGTVFLYGRKNPSA